MREHPCQLEPPPVQPLTVHATTLDPWEKSLLEGLELMVPQSNSSLPCNRTQFGSAVMELKWITEPCLHGHQVTNMGIAWHGAKAPVWELIQHPTWRRVMDCCQSTGFSTSSGISSTFNPAMPHLVRQQVHHQSHQESAKEPVPPVSQPKAGLQVGCVDSNVAFASDGR